MGRKTHERESIPKDPSTLGMRLRYVRLCRRYPRGLWCKYTEFVPRTVLAWERGDRSIPHRSLRWWAYYAEVPIEWLVTGEGEPPVRPMTAAEQLMSIVDIKPETRLKQLRRSNDLPLPDLKVAPGKR